MNEKSYFTVMLCALFLSHTATIHGQNANYIKIETMLDKNNLNRMTTYRFYDGLGRFFQSATNGIGQNGNYVYHHQEYDGIDISTRQWLPVIGTNNPTMLPTNIIKDLSIPLYDDTYTYIQTKYDVLKRPVKTAKAGKCWAGAEKVVKKDYFINVDDVFRYTAPMDGKNSLTHAGCYTPGTLYGTKTTDEEGKTLTIYTNLQGQKILERRGEHNDTYFVYNDLGQLRFMLTPKYQQFGNKDLFAYEYRYDHRGRVVKKLLPGCKYMQYWYDRNDRVIFFQDENLRAKRKYRYWLYDVLGRLAVQGLCDDCKRDDSKLPVVTYNLESSGLLDTGYLLNMEDLLNNPSIEQVNYYDNYNFLHGSMKDKFAKMAVNTDICANGFLTGSVSKASNGEYLYEVYSYDLNGNITEKKIKNLGGLLEYTRNIYTFTNNLKESSSEVNVGYGQPFLATTTYTFNKHNDKPETCITTVSHSEEQQMSSISYTYDALGQLKSVTRPFGSEQGGIVNYEYDLHGWTKQITTNSFKERLFYADGPGIPCYNGNISSLTWENAGYKQRRGYKFTYDNLNRITNAVYGERDDLSDKADHYNETLEYDINGNIMRLQRRGLKQDGQYGNIDNLHLAYNGNQPAMIKEDAEPILYEGAFNLNGKGEHRLVYNGNGALQADETRGITMIEYDATNNPRRIQFTNGNVTEYVYTPSGQKLRTIHYTAIPNIKVEFGQVHPLTAGEILYSDSIDYMMGGKLTMRNRRIERFLFEGGYCRATGTRNQIMPPHFLGITVGREFLQILLFQPDGKN